MKKKVLLIITDGLGHSKKKKFNSFLNAKTPTYDNLFKTTPNSLLKTSGKRAGLPNGQMGNSEVGHQIIGAGRVLHQNIIKINDSIKKDVIKNNSDINKLIKSSNSIHIAGLLSDGGIHSHINHFLHIAKLCANSKKQVYFHIFADGRDVPPNSVKKYINLLNKKLDNKKNISIATISGRYYSMDRDENWDRIKKAYDAIINATPKTSINLKNYIDSSYEDKIFDEFIKPISLNDYTGVTNKSDGFIFINFRNDRMRSIVNAITQNNFKKFKRSIVIKKALTMTQYDEKFKCPILFPKDIPKNTLGEVISKNDLTQARIAETEKYAHVTFFFNGGLETLYKNETRFLINSPNVYTYDQRPEMSANEVCNKTLESMDKNTDFIVVNFANCDMVGHTANYKATIKAVECVDTQISKLCKKAQETNYSIVLTSDHGNCEEVRTFDDKPITKHTTNDVYCFVIDKNVKKINNGGLNNIAPTVLKLLNIKIPKEMDKPLY